MSKAADQAISAIAQVVAMRELTDAATEKREMLQRALAINEQHYGPNHAEVASTLSNLPCAHAALGDARAAALGAKETKSDNQS